MLAICLTGHYFASIKDGAVEEKAVYEKGRCVRSTTPHVAGQVPEDYSSSEQRPGYSWLAYLRQQSNV
jgi:hypothetical protein